MIRILSSDILIADVITKTQGNPRLMALVEKYQLKMGGKVAIDRAAYEAFKHALQGHETIVLPGGSSANTLTTLSKLLPDAVDIYFLGVLGSDAAATMIRTSLEETRITLLPEQCAGNEAPQAATSFVMVFLDGQRTIATYPGNARALLLPEMITDALVQRVDAALIQGSLWMKMGAAYADRLLGLCQRFGKKIWLALPTYSMSSGAHADTFRTVIAAADMVLGNEEELSRIYHCTAPEALAQLQATLNGKVGFITHGAEGASLVTEAGIEAIAPLSVSPHAIVNTLGAGDTAFAGFLAGHICGKTPRQSAEIAMALASAKLAINGARLPDPTQALKTILGKSLSVTN